MKILGLEFAPLNIPLSRRLQTAVVLFHIVTFLFLGSGSILLLISLLFTPFCWISLLYLTWYIYDFNQSSRGGRKLDWVGRLSIWNYYRDYFPVKLIKTADLDPEFSYIIGHHPHGVIGFGAFINFLTEANSFSKLFPGINTIILSLKMLHYLPIQREYSMALGACDVSKESIKYLMKTKGNAAIIVIGGAREVLWANPGETKLVLKNRKGFVKLALQTGAHLVPSFSFGENEVYRLPIQPKKDSIIRYLQQTFQHIIGVAPVLFVGRGIFNYTFGIMPFRKPITTIVGKPIFIQRTEEPTQEQIDQLHSRYMQELKELFDSNKAQCGYPGEELEFVD